MLCRVAAAQIGMRKTSYEKALDDARDVIHVASKSGAQIVCLPEHWLLEHWKQAGDATVRLAETAGSVGILVITGANYLLTDHGVRVRSSLISPDQGIIGWQDKVHLFRDERKVAGAGEEYSLFDTPLGRVGITICYDNVFPEAARTLALQGADMLFVPSRIVSEGLDPWSLYLKTRALENRIPIVAPTVFDPPRYPGGSVIIDLKTNTTQVVVPWVVASAGSREEVIVADIDLNAARRLRLKRLSERVPRAYR